MAWHGGGYLQIPSNRFSCTNFLLVCLSLRSALPKTSEGLPKRLLERFTS
ncbi:Protein lethal(2) giant larvaelike [Caligus rogercresseyi]|uniref:Protein lethal(2) giant larvaelike n=1 Tax=Caligus rogercresseyi TaxID=217165 RepID=A0A7T8KBY3_CALRO|nr:Protein lethal(2) giant larvaelike [Caligus rogercresseyi]